MRAPKEILETSSVETAGKFVDSLVVPVDIQNSIIPADITWDGKSRTLDYLGQTTGASCRFRSSRAFGKRSTRPSPKWDEGHFTEAQRRPHRDGQSEIENYRWKAVETSWPSRTSGLSRHVRTRRLSHSRVFSEGKRRQLLFLSKISNTTNRKASRDARNPICDWLMSYMDGFYNGVVNKPRASSSRPGRCAAGAMGDPYCAFAHMIKDNKKDILDWKQLESSWKEL